jgi:hypothetical protein
VKQKISNFAFQRRVIIIFCSYDYFDAFFSDLLCESVDTSIKKF